MKKTLSLVLITLSLLLCLCACGKNETAFSAADMSLTIEGTEITAQTPAADVLAALGDGYEYAEAISCVYEGMDKTFTYENVTLYTYPDGEQDCLMEVYCVGGNVTTAKGITFGASKADITAQYGEGYTEAGSVLSYELPTTGSENVPASLYFLLENDQVTAIAMTAEHRAE